MSIAKIRISPVAILPFAAFILLARTDVLCAVLCAIAIHELGHFAVLRLFGGRVRKLGMTARGLEMYPECRLSYPQELLALFSGPLANLLFFILLGLLGHLWDMMYLFGGAQLLLGLFNLLPIRGLDGSDILWIGLALIWDPDLADRETKICSVFFSVFLVALSGFLVCRFRGGVFLLWTSLALFLSGLKEIGVVKFARKR